MDCPYRNNAFCSKLTQQQRAALCDGHCHLRTYGKDQRMSYRYWENAVAVLLDGMMVFGEFDPKGKYSTIQMGGPGEMISPGELVDVWHESYSDCEALCVLPCTMAVLDADVARRLFDTDIDFAKLVYHTMYTSAMESYQAVKSIGSRSAAEAVRYILTWCKRNGIPEPTHEVIAMLCNRSRPTVTVAIHELLMSNPELFTGEYQEDA